MVVLTEALIKNKAKVEKLEEVRNLNVCGQGLDDVSVLQQAPNIEVLSLSVNRISSLRHFAFCSGLKQLYLRANAVSDLAEIRYLMALPNLSVLWLADNPCTKLPHYRAFVVANLPKLENLDNVTINEADRRAAQGVRLLQPATAADVLAEEQEAVQEMQLQPDECMECTAAQDPTRSPPQQQQQQSPLPSPRPAATGATPSPTSPAPSAAGAHQGYTPRPGGSPEPVSASSQVAAAAQRSRSITNGCTTMLGPLRGPSANGSYRTSPEPSGEHGMLQSRGYSVTVTPRDLGNASSTGVNVLAVAGDVHSAPRQVMADHSCCSAAIRQQQQYEDPAAPRRVWPPAGAEQACQHTTCPGCLPTRQHSASQWRGAESAGSYCSPGLLPGSSASRTNVLYAVMALLGELDVSGLGIVQREVQLRLMEQQ